MFARNKGKASGTPDESSSLDIVGPSSREVLRRLELDVTRRLDGLLQGNNRGLVPGHGTELGETRLYAAGDDVRRIDWNVTARLQETHIRQTIAERELQAWIVVDRSSRLDWGTAMREKREVALAAAAAFGFLTARDGNRLGAVLLGRGEPEVIPARGSRKHLFQTLHRISDTPREDLSGATDLAEGLARLSGVAKRRGMVTVISDFIVAPGWEDSLRILSRRHDVIAVQVVDPREYEIPNVGMIVIRDPATGKEREVATNKKKVRDAYAKAATERQEKLDETLRHARIEHLTLSTDRPWLDDLVKFVADRKQRVGHVRKQASS